MPILGASCGRHNDPDRLIPNKPWDDRCCCPGIKCCVPLSVSITSNGWVGTSVGDEVGPPGQMQGGYGYTEWYDQNNPNLDTYIERVPSLTILDVLNCDTINGLPAPGATAYWWPRITIYPDTPPCNGQSRCYPPPENCEGVIVDHPWCDNVPNMCSDPPTNPNYDITIRTTSSDEDNYTISAKPPKCWHRVGPGRGLSFDEDRNTTVQAFKDRGKRYPEVDYEIIRQNIPSSGAKEAVLLYETFPKRWTFNFGSEDNTSPIIMMNMISEDLNNDGDPDIIGDYGGYLGVNGLNYDTGFVIDQKCGPRNNPDGRRFPYNRPYFESLWCEADTNVAKPKLAAFIESVNGNGCILSLNLKPNLFTRIHQTLPGPVFGTAGVKGSDCSIDIPLYCHDDVTYDADGQPLYVTNFGASDGIPNDHGTKYIWPNGWKVDTVDIIMPGSGYSVGEYIKFKYFEDPVRGGEGIMRPVCRGNKQVLTAGGLECVFDQFGDDCCDSFYDPKLGVEHAAKWIDEDGYTGESIDTAIHKVFYQRAKIIEVDSNGGIKAIKILSLTRTQYATIEDMIVGNEVPSSKKYKYYVSYGRILCHSKSVFYGGTEYSEGDTIQWKCKPSPQGMVKDQKTNTWYNINTDNSNACVEDVKAEGVVVDVDEYGGIQEWFIMGSDAWISNNNFDDPEITIGQKLNAYTDTGGDTPCALIKYNCSNITSSGIGFLLISDITLTNSDSVCPDGYTLIETENGKICRKIINQFPSYNECISGLNECEGDCRCVPSVINMTKSKCVAEVAPNAYENIMNLNGDVYDKRGRYYRDGYSLCDMTWTSSYPIRTATYPKGNQASTVYAGECYGTENVLAQVYEHAASLSVNVGIAKWPFQQISNVDYTDVTSINNNGLDPDTILATLFPLYPKHGTDYTLAQVEIPNNGILQGGNDSAIGGSITNVVVAQKGAGFSYLETKHIEPILPNNFPSPSGGGNPAHILNYSFIKHDNYLKPNRTYWTAPGFIENANKYSWFEVNNIILDTNNRGTGYVVDEIYEIYPTDSIPNNLELSSPDNCPNGSYYDGIFNRADFTQEGFFNWEINGYKYVEQSIPGTTNTRLVKIFTPGRNSKCRIKIKEVNEDGGIVDFEIMPELDSDGNVRTYDNGSIIRQGGVMYRTVSAEYKRQHPDFYCYISSSTGYGAKLESIVDTTLNGDGGLISVSVVADTNMIDPKNPPNTMPIGGRDYTMGDMGILWEFDGNFGPGNLLAHWCRDNMVLYTEPDKADWIVIYGNLPAFKPMSSVMTTNACPNDIGENSIDLLNKTYPLYISIGSIRYPRIFLGGTIRYDMPNYYDSCSESEVIPPSNCYIDQAIEGFGMGYICSPQSFVTLRSRDLKPFYDTNSQTTFYYYIYTTIVVGMNMIVQSQRDCNSMIEYNAGVP